MDKLDVELDSGLKGAGAVGDLNKNGGGIGVAKLISTQDQSAEKASVDPASSDPAAEGSSPRRSHVASRVT